MADAGMEPHWPNTTLALLLHSSVPKKWCEPWSCRQQERLGLLTSLQRRQGCYKPTWGHRCFHCAMPVAAHVCNWSRTSQSLNTLPGKGPMFSKVRNAWCLGRLLASLSPVTLTCIINIKLHSFPGLHIYVIQVLDVNEKNKELSTIIHCSLLPDWGYSVTTVAFCPCCRGFPGKCHVFLAPSTLNLKLPGITTAGKKVTDTSITDTTPVYLGNQSDIISQLLWAMPQQASASQSVVCWLYFLWYLSRG